MAHTTHTGDPKTVVKVKARTAAQRNKRNGPLPTRGLPTYIVVTTRINTAELKAMKAAMKAVGIATKSLFVAQAVRAMVKANGITIPDIDPAQGTLLPIDK